MSKSTGAVPPIVDGNLYRPSTAGNEPRSGEVVGRGSVVNYS